MPGSQDSQQQQKKEKREAADRVEQWALACVPANLREGLSISVQEVQCGDPSCAPIDTAITMIYQSGGRGMTGIPMEVQEVEEADLKHAMPDEKTLKAWSEGKEAEWPPDDDMDGAMMMKPELRFEVGDAVECRIGNDPVTGWAAGKVIQLWYREPGWPPNSFAPYKILLEDGRNIFAPADLDQVIRKKQG